MGVDGEYQEAVRHLDHHAAKNLDRNLRPRVHFCHRRFSVNCRLHGGYGVTDEYEISHFYRKAMTLNLI